MATTPQTGHPTPERIFDTLNAYQRTAALRGAIDLDLFTRIDEGASTAAEVAAKLNAPLRGARIICDYLVIVGFLTKQGDRYSLTPDSAMFLSRRSPAYLGGTVTFLNAPVFQDYFRDVAAILDGALQRGKDIGHEHDRLIARCGMFRLDESRAARRLFARS